jgi:hypothetical protein
MNIGDNYESIEFSEATGRKVGSRRNVKRGVNRPRRKAIAVSKASSKMMPKPIVKKSVVKPIAKPIVRQAIAKPIVEQNRFKGRIVVPAIPKKKVARVSNVRKITLASPIAKKRVYNKIGSGGTFNPQDGWYTTQSRTIDLFSNADGVANNTNSLRNILILGAIVAGFYYANKKGMFKNLFN